MNLFIEFLTFAVATAVLYFACNQWGKADAEEIKKDWGQRRNGSKFHRQRLIYKGASVVFSSWVYALDFTAPVEENIVRFFAYAYFAIWFWWFFFDQRINFHMGNDRYYIGENAQTDTFLEVIQKKYKLTDKQVTLRVKVPGMISAVLVLIIVAVYFR